MELNPTEIDSLAKKQDEIVSALNQANVVGPCTNDNKCLQQTVPMRGKAGERKLGYDQHDPRRMCRACEIFWYADMARIRMYDLHKLTLLEQHAAARSIPTQGE